MKAKVVLVLGLSFFGGAVYALHTDKMKVISVCRDSRRYMDGGIDAEILGGGLSYRHVVKVFEKKNNKDVFLQDFTINSETHSSEPVQVLLSGASLKLSVFKNQKQTDRGYPGKLEAFVKGDKVSVDVFCEAKKI